MPRCSGPTTTTPANPEPRTEMATNKIIAENRTYRVLYGLLLYNNNKKIGDGGGTRNDSDRRKEERGKRVKEGKQTVQ